MGIFIKNNCDCCPPSVCEPCDPGDPCAATQGTGTLYFGPTSWPYWEDVNNWWQDAAATIPALAVPWASYFYNPGNPGCIPYYNYNLTLATGGVYGPVTFSDTIIGGGICDMDGIENNYVIAGGTFTGDRFWNNQGRIDGGTFTGDTFFNDGYIYGGTFSNNGFLNNGGYSFDGINFYYQGHIYGGTWAGSGFVNNNGRDDNPGYVCAPSWPVQTC